MNKVVMLTSAFFVILGCASGERPCEDVTATAEQVQACQTLQHQINNGKDHPLMRTELERRYQIDCVDGRYYRDRKQSAVCGNKGKIAQHQLTLLDALA